MLSTVLLAIEATLVLVTVCVCWFVGKLLMPNLMSIVAGTKLIPFSVALAALGAGYLESLRGFDFHFEPFTYDSSEILPNVSMPRGMRAAVYTLQEQVGVKMSMAPIPHHSRFSALIRVKAVALNPSNFKHPMIPAAWPFLRHLRQWPVGYDVAGEVLSVGKAESCIDLNVGDRAWGIGLGVAGEYAVVPCWSLVPIPSKLNFSEAAGLGVAGLTTTLAYERSSLQKGQSVLVIGASGGCGQFGVMIAGALGAHVTGLCSKKNKGFVKGLQPSPAAVVDYSSPDEMAKLVAGGQQFDLIYDTVSSGAPEDPNYEAQMRPLLKPGGLYQAIGGPIPDKMDAIRAFLDMVTRPLGVNVQRAAYDWFLLMPSKKLMLRLNSFFESGKMGTIAIDSTYDAMKSDTAIDEAMERQKSRRAVGKIILSFAGV